MPNSPLLLVLLICLVHTIAWSQGNDPAPQLRFTMAVAADGKTAAAVVAGGTVDRAGDLRNARVLIIAPGVGRVWDHFDSSLHPWMVRAGRFAGRNVLLVGVRKVAVFDPVERKRPFLYEIKPGGQGLAKVWLGTSLSRPFEFADFADLDGADEDELVALEWTREGFLGLAAYRWQGFGVEGIARSKAIPGAQWLQPGDVWSGGGEEVIAEACEDGLLRFAAFGLRETGLEPVAEVWVNPGKGAIRWAPAPPDYAGRGGILISNDRAARVVRFRALPAGHPEAREASSPTAR